MESGREQNYWPGFVDALSNVVLTLVFVLVIFVFALMLQANKVANKMKALVEAEQAEKAGQAQLNKALSELEQLRQQASKSGGTPVPGEQPPACVQFSKSDASQKAEVSPEGNYVLVNFGPSAITVTEETQKAMQDFLARRKAALGGTGQVMIEASEDPNSASPLLARETQLGRILNIRTGLLKAGIDPKAIMVHNIVPSAINGSFNWVKIHVEK